MNKIKAGTGALITGVILFLGLLLSYVDYGLSVGWDNVQGLFWQVWPNSDQTGILVVSIIGMVVGVMLLILENLEKSEKRYEIREQHRWK
jgi:preprotein translocase subunit SecE